MTVKRSRYAVVLGMVAALMLSLLVAPAAANKVPRKAPLDAPSPAPDVKDVGTIDARAKVGKNRTGCADDGTSSVFGGGLGLPVQGTKLAYYQIGNPDSEILPGSPNNAVSIFNPDIGKIKICGRLSPMLDNNPTGGLGAACGSSKGWDGKGSITYPPNTKPTIWLDKVGWKVSVTTFIVTGQAWAATPANAKNKKSKANDILVAQIQTFGGAVPGCLDKQPNPVVTDPKTSSGPGSGARVFNVMGSYQIANGEYDDIDLNRRPGTCKKSPGTSPTKLCQYKSKTKGKSG